MASFAAGDSGPRNQSSMGKIGAEICSICKENPSKYRCPGCAAPYCSLACNKTHKSGAGGDNSNPPCTGKRAQPEDAKSGNKTNGNLQVSSSNSSGGQSPGKRPRCAEPGDGDGGSLEAVTTACVRKGRDQWRGGREDREDEEWQMSADQRKRISGSAWLKAALRDPKLQKLLVSSTTCTL